MRHFLFLTCFFFSTILFAQDRISELKYEGTSAKYFVQKVDGVNYLLKRSISDELSIYTLNEDYSTTLVRVKLINGIFSDILIRPIGEFLYTFDGRDPIVYNFVTNEEVRYELPQGWFPQYWSYPGTRMMSIGTTNYNNSSSKRFIADDIGGISEPGPTDSFGHVIENHIVLTAPFVNDVSLLSAKNMDTGIVETLLSRYHSNKQIINGYHEFLYYYLNDQNHPSRFDGRDGSKKVISELTIDIDEIEEIAWVGNYLIIMREDSLRDEHIDIYNSDNGSMLSTYAIEKHSSVSLDYSRLVGDKLIFGDDELYVVDLASLQLYSFNSLGSTYYPNSLIDNKYIIIRELDFDNDYALINRLVDLRDMSISDLDMVEDIIQGYYSNVVSVGNKFLGIFSSFNSFPQKTVFQIDIDGLTVKHDDKIDNSFFGLPGNDTALLKFGDNLLLASRDIYSVKDDKVEIVNSSEIEEVMSRPYFIEKENITFMSNSTDGVVIHSYDGNTLNSEAVIPIPTGIIGPSGNVSDYVTTDKNVFYLCNKTGYSFETDLMRYDKISKTISKVADGSSFNLFRRLASNAEHAYYIFEEDLYHIGDDGSLLKLFDSEEVAFQGVGLFSSRDNIYFMTNSDFYFLNGKELDVLYSDNFEYSTFINSFGVDPNYVDNSLMLEVNNGSSYYYLYVRDSIARKVTFDLRISQIKVNNDDNFLISTAPDIEGVRSQYLYKGMEDTLHDLTSLDLGRNPFNIHFVEDIPYIVSSNVISSEMNIYEISSDFTKSELKYSFSNSFSSNGANFKVFGLEGMLYSNDHIFLMEEGYVLYELEVSGTGDTPEMESNDGYVYFVGQDAEYGNQLYRVLLYSFRVGTDDLRPIERIIIYPNPASDFISVSDDIEGKFTILNQLGQVLSSGWLMQSKIDISQLNEGLHYLKIEKEDKIFISNFVKVK